MTRRLYVIYDKVALESGPNFEAKNDGIALRNFQRFIAEKKNEDNLFFATDMELIRVGTIDKETNEIGSAPEEPEIVVIDLSHYDQIQEENE